MSNKLTILAGQRERICRAGLVLNSGNRESKKLSNLINYTALAARKFNRALDRDC